MRDGDDEGYSASSSSSASSASTASSSKHSSSASIQIRTSSPISSISPCSSSSRSRAHTATCATATAGNTAAASSAQQALGDSSGNNTEAAVISPSKFMAAVRISRAAAKRHQHEQQQQQPTKQPNAHQYERVHSAHANYLAWMKETAFDKLRRQQQQQQSSELPMTAAAAPSQKASTTSESKLVSCGKLKLAIYNIMNQHLTVHIMQAQSLKQSTDTHTSTKPQQQQLLSSAEPTYARISLHDPSTCVTRTVAQTQPVRAHTVSSSKQRSGSSSSSSSKLTAAVYRYDAKFSFELASLLHSDGEMWSSRRLVISLWTSERLVGCLSFKLKHLAAASDNTLQSIRWYHLLPLKYGMSKHLRCASATVAKARKASPATTTTTTTTSASSLGSARHQQPATAAAPVITNVNKDIADMTSVTLTLVKANISATAGSEAAAAGGDQGYGFTLVGSCPCMVGRVEAPHSAAHVAGLRAGDYISSINGKNVSRATCHTLVKLIKSCKNRLEMQVHRQQQPQAPGAKQYHSTMPVRQHPQFPHQAHSLGHQFSSFMPPLPPPPPAMYTHHDQAIFAYHQHHQEQRPVLPYDACALRYDARVAAASATYDAPPSACSAAAAAAPNRPPFQRVTSISSGVGGTSGGSFSSTSTFSSGSAATDTDTNNTDYDFQQHSLATLDSQQIIHTSAQYQPQPQQPQQSTSSQTNLLNYQQQLEAVPEEEEDDGEQEDDCDANQLEGDDDGDIDIDIDEQDEEEGQDAYNNDAHTLRRLAAQYCSRSSVVVVVPPPPVVPPFSSASASSSNFTRQRSSTRTTAL